MKTYSVLLIDDNEIDNFISGSMLKRSGIVSQLSEHTSAKEALNLLLKNKKSPLLLPEIIFLDIRMPGMDGFEFLDQFAQLPGEVRNEIRVVMLSSSGDSVDRERALSSSEVFSFLMKPLKLEDISDLRKKLEQ